MSISPAPGFGSSGAEEIVITLPALASFSRIARLALSAIATRLEFTYDEIEDLRIAVGEVYGILGEDPNARIRFSCLLGDDDLVIAATRVPAGSPATVSALSQQILSAVVDEATVDARAARVSFAKRHEG